MTHAWNVIVPEEMSGETLNDAIFNRNKKIEEIYNISIKAHYTSSFTSAVRNVVNAGDSDYSVVFGDLNILFNLAQEGMFYNWHTMAYTDTSAVWWDQSVVDQLTYKGQLYTIIGDISPVANVRVFSLVFNKDMIRELGLDMPYQTVLDGKWTIDVLKGYITDVNHDVNGDSKMDFEDRWGYFSQYGNSYMQFFCGGGRLTEFNSKGELELVFNKERNVELVSKALSISTDPTTTLFANPIATGAGNSWTNASNWFAGGGALFRSSVFEPVPRDYRDMDVDFGVLPYPKLDDNQTNYYALGEYFTNMFSVPITSDAEFASLIMEAMSAESVSTVSPAFYDVCLDGKVVRDEESKEMLDIIFTNKVYDIGFIADFMSFKVLMQDMDAAYDRDIASKFAANLASCQSKLADIVKNFDSLPE